MPESSLWRLQKFLAHAGICSRRHAERLILEGRVSVNGEIVKELGTKINPRYQEVKVDGRPVFITKQYKYYMLHKPRGLLTTMHDPHGRPTIRKLISHINTRVYPIGRLDKDSEGLLLLTNDGDLSNKLLHPRFKVAKTYIVTIDGRLSRSQMQRFKAGIEIHGSAIAKAKEIKYLRGSGKRYIYEIVLQQGLKRQIRLMVKSLGYRVTRLKRIKIGPISLDDLPPGEIRPLTDSEIDLLRKHVQG